MTDKYSWPRRRFAAHSLHSALLSFPIACFSLTVLSDFAYVRTLNLQWLHFSEWLLLIGLVFGVFSIVAHMLDFFIHRIRPSWFAVIAGVGVMLLATVNSFVHTADGWTAVMPFGITLSILTVLAMVATWWFTRVEVHHA